MFSSFLVTDFENVWGFLVTEIVFTTTGYYIIQVFKAVSGLYIHSMWFHSVICFLKIPIAVEHCLFKIWIDIVKI